MKILILDDERNARENLKSYLQNCRLEIDEIREAASVKEGLQVLADYSPDLAFLDINLPDGVSFDLLTQLGLPNIHFKIIFISAYDQYAINAFKYNAIDYILKPINPVEFQQAVDKAIQSTMPPQASQLQNLSSDLSQPTSALNRLVLKDHQSIHLVDIDDIIRCQSENNYTRFIISGQEPILITRTLKEYEDLLKGKLFFRPHKSHLINLRHLRRYDKSDGGFIEMSDGSLVPLSRFKKDIFMKVLEQV